MLDKFFVELDDYRRNVTAHVEKNIIEEKQRELNVKIPQAMVEFYTHFGNDKEVLSSFYVFDTVENIRFEYDALCFGEKHEGMGRLGIKIEDLNAKYPTVCWYSYDMKEWYVEEGVSVVFFFGIASWQVLNTMPSVAKVRLSKDEFKHLVGSDLQYLCEDKLFLLGDVIPVFTRDILGCYLVEDEELYLGAMTDEMLEKYEELLGLDLDWL